MNPPQKKHTASDENTDSSAFLVLCGRVRLLSNPILAEFQGSAGASPSHFRGNRRERTIFNVQRLQRAHQEFQRPAPPRRRGRAVGKRLRR